MYEDHTDFKQANKIIILQSTINTKYALPLMSMVPQLYKTQSNWWITIVTWILTGRNPLIADDVIPREFLHENEAGDGDHDADPPSQHTCTEGSELLFLPSSRSCHLIQILQLVGHLDASCPCEMEIQKGSCICERSRIRRWIGGRRMDDYSSPGSFQYSYLGVPDAWHHGRPCGAPWL